MAYTNDVDLQAVGTRSSVYYDEPDASETLGLGCIIAYSAAGAFRHAVAANTTDKVVGVATMRFRGANDVTYKRIHEGRFLFALDDPSDAVIANRFLLARAVTKSTVSVDPAATGPICGIVDEFRRGLACVRFDIAIVQAINLGITLPA